MSEFLAQVVYRHCNYSHVYWVVFLTREGRIRYALAWSDSSRGGYAIVNYTQEYTPTYVPGEVVFIDLNHITPEITRKATLQEVIDFYRRSPCAQ